MHLFTPVSAFLGSYHETLSGKTYSVSRGTSNLNSNQPTNHARRNV